ncbi:MAG: Y-family DNA polymerase [Holosporales bacterium]
MNAMLGLLDCNNFFVSCERVFNPRLASIPVVVLSNNDGCVVARSEEAKSIGVQMGQPYFTLRPLQRRYNLVAHSANFELYGDMSYRMMQLLRRYSEELEVYSIDEAFFRCPQLTLEELHTYARSIRQESLKCLGLPISLGIAPTKTLTKVAGQYAKKHPQGVMILSPETAESYLRSFAIEDVWGIGRKNAGKLRRLGITTAWHLRQSETRLIRRHLTVVGARLALELQGYRCFDLQQTPEAKQSITFSRTFAKPTDRFDEVAEAIAHYTARAGEKLRRDQQVAGCIHVYVTTHRHNGDPYYAASKGLFLETATADTRVLLNASRQLWQHLYQPGFRYNKAYVTLSQLSSPQEIQLSLMGENLSAPQSSAQLMKAIDGLNLTYGRGTLSFGAEGFQRPWLQRPHTRSPRYTTRWGEELRAY